MTAIPGIPGAGLSQSAKDRRTRLSALSGAQNHRCCYCGRRFDEHGPDSAPTIEHVRARSRGGANARTNLAVACQRCNNLRGNMNAYRFFKLRLWEAEGVTPPEWDYVPPIERATLGDIFQIDTRIFCP